ncbi:MAG: NosD domain-containing protein, partial [Candidatus Heimdallarchaeota archaeon]
NTLTGNTATNNDDYGIYLTNSTGNTIYNNYFDNDRNAYDDGTNAWNSTRTYGKYNIIGERVIGGNYWGDYRGADADRNEIGDTPYEIPGGANRDYLPLVEEQPFISPTPVGLFPIPGGPVGMLFATLLLAIRSVRREKRKSR